MARKNPAQYECPVDVPLAILGGRWKPILVFYLLGRGPLRNGELLRLIPRVTQKMLTQQLRELEADGIVNRTIHDRIPRRVEYSLTDERDQLEPLLHAMCQWGTYWADKTGARIEDVNSPRDQPKGRKLGPATARSHPSTRA
jgi:DNA-binding HxlR family transcriptional regulator